MNLISRTTALSMLVTALAISAFAQTTEFTYQGSLQNSSAPANGNFDFEFLLFDAVSGGAQVGTTVTRSSVAVASGTFAVKLDFGAQFPGANRFLEIRVRTTGGGAFTPLTPRQQISNSPYAVRSLTATSADTAANATNALTATSATTATNATQLGGVAANQYVLTGDARLSDARPPLAGSSNYIQNGISTQAASNFNISGNGTASFGTLWGQNINSSFEYRIGGQPFLNAVSSNSFFGTETGSANLGLGNTYAGYRAGNAATSNASNNAFFGANAGRLNSNGVNNSFFGVQAGELNTFGGYNAFFGNLAGAVNGNGNRNAFFGVTAGRDNTQGSDNTFVGGAAGQANISGGDNSFFGSVAGTGNTTGSHNSFIGRGSGNQNVSGTFNTALGSGANVGSGNLSFATAIGSGAIVSTSNTIALGRSTGQDTVVVPGNLSVTGTINGTVANATNATQLGGVAANQYVVTTDPRMTDARAPTAGSSNYIQNQNATAQSSNFNISGNGTVGGTLSGNVVVAATQFNIGGSRVLSSTGFQNLFAGAQAGSTNTTGFSNSFFGHAAGVTNSTGASNSFFGQSAGASNTIGYVNAFFGVYSGSANTSGNYNAFYGSDSGANNTTGVSNTFVGNSAGQANVTGMSNTLIGSHANVGTGNLINATAIGSGSMVNQNNSLILGSISGVNGAIFDTNVGIGTTTPVNRLHVNGTIRVTNGAVYITNPNTVIITSPNGACWGITVGNTGVLSTFPVTPCP